MVYLDLLFILNLWIDFLLLVTTNIILKYNSSYKRIFISSLIGGLSTFLVFISNSIILFIMKILIAVIMQLIVNKYNGIKSLIENVIYFYFINIILAGSLFLLNIEDMNIVYYYFLLFLFTPIILYIYQKKIKKINSYYKERYDVIIYYKNKKYTFNAYLDTGNKIYDPYKRRPISIVYTKKLKFDYKNGLIVPIETANGNTLLKCIKVDKLIIDNKVINNALIGLSSIKFNIQDINMILHKDML